MEFTAFTQRLFEKALSRGAEACEAYMSAEDSFEAMVQEGELTQYNVAKDSSLTFRCLAGGKMGVASTQVLDEEALEFLVSGALENAALIENEDEQFFAPAGGEYKAMDGYSDEVAALSPAEKIQLAKDLEKMAKEADQRIKPEETFVFTGISESRLVNSLGLDVSYRDSQFGFGAYVMAKDGDKVAVGGRMLFGRKPAALSPKEAVDFAVKEALDGLEGKSVKSGEYPVILRRDVAAEMLRCFASVFSAEMAQKGLSLLKGREGEVIASPAVTIVDDPHHAEGSASRPFDREGSPTRPKNVVEKGVLTTLLHSLKTAKKQGVKTTGNASLGGVAPSNFYFAPGEKSLEEMAKAMGHGLIITNLAGMHAGANQISGDFSLGAKGYLVENGEIGRSVRQITVAGNFFAMLKDIVETGSDFEFTSGGAGAPSVWVKGLSVAGE